MRENINTINRITPVKFSNNPKPNIRSWAKDAGTKLIAKYVNQNPTRLQNITPSVSEIIIRVPENLCRVPLASRRYLGPGGISPNLHTYILFRTLNLWCLLRNLLSLFHVNSAYLL